MEKKIDATLDLAKSLKDFEIQVTKLLELTNVSVWDGQVFKEREQKIRDSALILAGQCIALFLYNLSQSQSVLDTAKTQTSWLVASQNPKTWFSDSTNINNWECTCYFKITVCSNYQQKKG
ncbi:hypothetical protein GXM_08957 [Nostoc sphaeroides CCNUC1]|uniref:Uncharacterized protein n=1 Tax=Nostoc sphaeroides CCNUC1 TaxID=2653204 RepID=A0A5P8WF63_9NOSO|nr:hypothetical protein GXM_08957 [Nostoc sphaeroides CCNUC1]